MIFCSLLHLEFIIAKTNVKMYNNKVMKHGFYAFMHLCVHWRFKCTGMFRMYVIHLIKQITRHNICGIWCKNYIFIIKLHSTFYYYISNYISNLWTHSKPPQMKSLKENEEKNSDIEVRVFLNLNIPEGVPTGLKLKYFNDFLKFLKHHSKKHRLKMLNWFLLKLPILFEVLC